MVSLTEPVKIVMGTGSDRPSAPVAPPGTTRATFDRFVAASLETLLNAIDANDPDTGAHVRRVATYALVLADAAGVSERERRLVEHVALFHDIGKIHEALYDIVHDGRKLSPADREAIVTHPQRGARVLAPIRAFYPELPRGILAHHERWDGRGYPRGMKGKRIPLAARVVAIVDTFDAITHHRRYRDGRSSESARDVILEERGGQFDPDLVDLFTFPGVFCDILVAQRRLMRWKPRVRQRRAGWDEAPAPDLKFRWSAGRRGGHRRVP